MHVNAWFMLLSLDILFFFFVILAEGNGLKLCDVFISHICNACVLYVDYVHTDDHHSDDDGQNKIRASSSSAHMLWIYCLCIVAL